MANTYTHNSMDKSFCTHQFKCTHLPGGGPPADETEVFGIILNPVKKHLYNQVQDLESRV